MPRAGERVKRVVDIVLAISLCPVAVPVALLVTLFILVTMGRPVLFRQLRPGFGGRPFELLKFRTMSNEMEAGGTPRSDADRLTLVGRWLRRASLDELPELWNVFRGDMSFVGPRPLLMEYLPLYSAHQARRHEVRPGLTGWAQVNGRNAISWERKFELDVWYVDNRSLWLDLVVLCRTVRLVISGEGISQAGHVTAEPFRGSPS
jgi:lipopolysaccharide/colanic/teichoic acid biosynthesis glycosyltransferase